LSLRDHISVALLIIVSVISDQSYSQPFVKELDGIQITDSQGIIKNTFSGGHNNLEPQFVDIDADGDYDIIFLDSDGTFGWYENKGSASSPDYELSLTNFPGLKIYDWFFFVDIDNDQDYDYFTANNDRISYYENNGTIHSPNFILSADTILDSEGNSIYSEAGSNPVYADVDGDGDYDFVSGNTNGRLRYYENIGTAEVFNFKFITEFWQNIEIIGTINGQQLHGACSLDFVDIDNDNDLDLFWGDFFSNSLYFIENQGTNIAPDLHVISKVYPIGPDSVNTRGFNMPRFVDIDNDQDYDLFVSVLYDPTVKQSMFYYRNDGTIQNPDHHLVTQDFLKSLDVGNSSIPVFCDIDNDGDKDLFIGSLNNPQGSIHFLRNTGSVSDPSFFYEDSAFANIFVDLSATPAFGDLDGDNDFDMIVGKFDGKLLVYPNTGSKTSPEFLSGADLLDNNNQVIDIGTLAVPQLIDVDNDNDVDLVIGGFNGKFEFYRNTGSATSYQFTAEQSYFDTLDVGDNSTPFMIDWDGDGKLDLFSGNRTGKLFFYKNSGTNSQPVWNFQTDSFISGAYGLGTAPNFIDIDNDTDYDLILGNVKGGLYFYNNTLITTVADWETPPDKFNLIQAYPNPFNPELNIVVQLKEKSTVNIVIYNILGERVKEVFQGDLNSGIHTFLWRGKNDSNSVLPSGSYIVQLSTNFYNQAIKVTFLK
jgi:FlgD Ig-like domain/FG-GAP-like repeat